MDIDSRPPSERVESRKPIAKIKNILKPLGAIVSRVLKKPLFLIPVILIVFAAGVIFYFNNKSSVLGTSDLPDITKKNEAEAKKIIEEVGKLTLLPDETPTVATVADVATLQKQPFFEKAQNGDKVLIFEKAKRAILYRPSTNRIIEIGPVVIPTRTPVPSGSVTPTIQPTVAPTEFIPTRAPSP
jgi:hypothetical protein